MRRISVHINWVARLFKVRPLCYCPPKLVINDFISRIYPWHFPLNLSVRHRNWKQYPWVAQCQEQVNYNKMGEMGLKFKFCHKFGEMQENFYCRKKLEDEIRRVGKHVSTGLSWINTFLKYNLALCYKLTANPQCIFFSNFLAACICLCWRHLLSLLMSATNQLQILPVEHSLK